MVDNNSTYVDTILIQTLLSVKLSLFIQLLVLTQFFVQSFLVVPYRVSGFGDCTTHKNPKLSICPQFFYQVPLELTVIDFSFFKILLGVRLQGSEKKNNNNNLNSSLSFEQARRTSSQTCSQVELLSAQRDCEREARASESPTTPDQKTKRTTLRKSNFFLV